MEENKKGDILVQLALISDLLENINLKCESKTVVIELTEEKFYDFYDKIVKKINGGLKPASDKFSLKLGDIDYVFNKSNV